MPSDLRLALRALRARPGFAAAVVLCLALGIGVNSTIYSMVSAVLLRPLPYQAPGALVALRQVQAADGRVQDALSLPNVADLRDRSRTLRHVAAYGVRTAALWVGSAPEGVDAAAVTGAFFETLGVAPLLGRTFGDAEVRRGERAVVLGHALWQERFAGAPGVVGRSTLIDGVPHTVVGVMPASFPLTNDVEQLYLPLDADAPALDRAAFGYRVVARLAPGATVAQADAEVRALGERLAADHPAANRGWSLQARALRDAMTPPEIRLMMAVMLGAVMLVLCVACANVANLMLGAGVGRAREMAVRTALGASRWRIARPLLVESVVLGLAGAGAGVVLAAWGLRATLASFPFQFPPWLEPAIDGRVLASTAALGLTSGVAFGLLPALRAAAVAPGAALQSGGRGATAGPTRSRVRDALVAVQLSLSLVLLVAAALMMKSFVLLQGVEPGYVPGGVLAVRVSLTADRFDARAARFTTLARLRERLAELPGVVEAAAAPQPPTALGGATVPLDVAGLDVPDDQRPRADLRPVVGAYLGALRVPLLAGRTPTFAESLDSTARVAVVSEGMARRVWPGASPIGRTLTVQEGEPLVVVGVAADARQRGLARAPGNTLYLPYASRPLARTMTFLLRTEGEPAALAAAARRAVAGVDPALAVLQTETLPALLDQSLWHERLFGRLFTAFGAAALVLAIVGLYGVVANATRQRTHEIGVRIAIGAQPADVRRLVLAGSARVVGTSLLVGLVLAAGLGRALASMLYGVSTADVAVYAGVTLALAGVALLAAWVPARRAARVDPVIALRAE